MPNFLIKTEQMSFNGQNDGKNCYLHFTACIKNLEAFVKFAVVSIPIVETWATIILFQFFFIYEISSYSSFYCNIIAIFCDVVSI